MPARSAVGLIGVGTMGSRMLERLIAAGYTVVARDISPQAESRAAQAGALVAASPAAVARQAGIVLLSLPMPADVDRVVAAEDGILAGAPEGSLIVDLSTVDPETTRRNAARAAQRGVGYLDAPVLGRPPACGRWTLPVGGAATDLERARPVLEVLASRLIHVGPSGWGNIVKLLNNMMFSAINAVTAEVLAVCAALGMDPQVFLSTVADSGAATVSNLFRELGPKILSRDFTPAFSLGLLHKDVRLALEMAAAARAPTIVTPATAVLLEMARARGYEAEDSSAVVKVLEALSGREVRPHGGRHPC
ncbi:MAG: NAD(P)-dependent oxidoreductase [Armatimonadota bacterium]|nr:NAD(P)-dependent oxidoreductase [Armatimonadota bacterium]MDR7427252.1 NAD(P)-dependent oxidoreductase [Armatimonadota bacterium]MDR7463174.1 NAD(P)-dependent oxidoreductase [Armatimonadota bacterium]MDR7468839.1 NAD(P)-dependent oxidoreductase [Armatimonadota bacterium]MDR7475419.1 NAD(P)-dependent oxidoreductase [Armatimonadota bacterium]